MNLKCKQRPYVNIRENLLIGRIKKYQNGLFRKIVKFQAMWSQSGSYLSAQSYVEEVLYATEVPWGKGMCDYLTDLLQILLVLFSYLAPDKGKRNHYWACAISSLLKIRYWSFIWILVLCNICVQIQDAKNWHVLRPCLGRQRYYLRLIFNIF